MSDRPHIVLTFADDQRFDTIARLGGKGVITPCLDRLTDRATAYTRAHHAGSTRGAVCIPSRAMLHTGRHLFAMEDYALEDPVGRPLPMLGERLREAGYRCVATGKWHNNVAGFERSFSEGRSVFMEGMASHFNTPMKDFTESTGWSGEVRAPAHSSDRFADAAIDLIRGHDGKQPLFLYCAFTAPHDPRTAPDEWRERFHDDEIELPPNFLTEHPFDNGTLEIRDELLAAMPRDPDEIRRHIADYYAMIGHMDEAIGRIHAALEEAGMSDDTLVIHSADHGLAVGQHGLLGKQNLYEHSARVPLMIAGPGFEAGFRDDRLCYQHDLNPTLLRCAGLGPADDTFFHDLRDAPVYDDLMTVYGEEQRMLSDGRHKLIEYRVPGQPFRQQLFDLAADPWETRDLSGSEPARVAAMSKRLAAWRESVDDPWLSEESCG